MQSEKVIYAHYIRGEASPFFIGSGSVARSQTFDRRPTAWTAYVDGRIDLVDVKIIERHACEGQARYREQELIGAANPPANFIAARSRAEGMLTGRRKGGCDCGCGRPDCRQAVWDTMAETSRDVVRQAHSERIHENVRSIGTSRPRRTPSVAVRPIKASPMIAGLSSAQARALDELLNAEAA